MKKVKAICKKTYPDEDDMISFYEGNIEPCDVKIYYKGKEYLVTPEIYNKEYYELIVD